MQGPGRSWLLAWAATIAASLSAWAAGGAGRIDFNREIRPMLADNCFACHGPDEQARKAKLRLDLKADAFVLRQPGDAVIVPGQAEQSRLFKRLVTRDPEDLMPPPKTGKHLTPEQIQKLRRWIAEGAEWPEHWAFVPPKPPPPPEVRNHRWVRNAIDRFVLARLETEGMTPSPEAPPAALVRRATLDLTGLPPTIEEVDAYLTDDRPNKYEALVDRLLASPRYGEHMARYWLDSVRYADSHGYHIDAQRDIWAYRDWVVNAFNANLPFDQFTIEQLAGDLLPSPSTDQRVATGFLRCNMSTGEGGVIEAEYAAKYAFDRTETTSTVWLGLTLTCARCHTHKYDPIAQREYYRLLAFLNQLDEPVMDGNRPNPDPFLKLPSRTQSGRLEWLKTHLADGQAKVDGPAPELDQSQIGWLRSQHERLQPGWASPAPLAATTTTTNGAALKILDDGSLLAGGPNPDTDVYEVVVRPAGGSLAALRLETLPHNSLPQKSSARAEDGRFQLSEFEADLVAPAAGGQPGPSQRLKFTQALADAAEGDQGIDRALDGRADTAWSVPANVAQQPHTALFLLAEPVAVPPNAELRVRLKFEVPKSRRALGHFRLALAQGEALVRSLHPPKFDPWQVLGPFRTEGLQAGFAQTYEPETTIDLKKTYPGARETIAWASRTDLADGATHLFVNELHGVHGAYYFYRTVQSPAPARLELSLRADDLYKVWVNGALVAERTNPELDPGVSTRFAAELQAGENRILLKVVNHQGAKFFAFNQTLGGPETLPPDLAAIVSTTPRPAGDWAPKVRDFYRRQHSESFREVFVNLAKWREEQTALDAAIPTTLVAKELAQPRETTLLMRGEYDKPGEKVTAGVPAVLPPLPPLAPTNRLGLAQWLVHPTHPLTARVVVNRFWQQDFGVGLVKTTEDFGVQGERPSHPELLDWLATEFVRTGWNVQRLQRLIVTSATYRQMSTSPPELLARDPENRLLARGPRFRLDAEVLRDTALFASGLLLDQRGGKSVKPFEPPGLWEAVSFNNSQKYVPDTGPARYRRSLYTHWKRQSPPPNMLIFDAPTREYCVVRRPRTNTPLQALAVLNDPQFVEASRALAQRMVTGAGPDATSRLAYGFRLATGRKPADDELRILRGLLERELAEYRDRPEAATQLLSVGDFKASPGVEPTELAAWTTVANLLLNLDETLTKG